MPPLTPLDIQALRDAGLLQSGGPTFSGDPTAVTAAIADARDREQHNPSVSAQPRGAGRDKGVTVPCAQSAGNGGMSAPAGGETPATNSNPAMGSPDTGEGSLPASPVTPAGSSADALPGGLFIRGEVHLPWPDRRLSPNARVHWGVLASAKAAARSMAGLLAGSQTPLDVLREVRAHGREGGWLRVHVEFRPWRRGMDDDNMIASLKPYRDGIAVALGVDDARWITSHGVGAPVKGGNVILTWEAVDAPR